MSTSAANVAPPPRPSSVGEDLLGARHLRHELGVDEARGLDAREPGGGQTPAQLGAHRRREDLGVVLQPVAGADVAENDAHCMQNHAKSP